MAIVVIAVIVAIAVIAATAVIAVIVGLAARRPLLRRSRAPKSLDLGADVAEAVEVDIDTNGDGEA